MIEPCTDPFDRKAVRGTMGSLFNLPLVRTAEVAELFAWLEAEGVRPVGADVYQGTMWGRGLWEGRVALVLGNEARGLSEDVDRYLQHWARLPSFAEWSWSLFSGVRMFFLKALSSTTWTITSLYIVAFL